MMNKIKSFSVALILLLSLHNIYTSQQPISPSQNQTTGLISYFTNSVTSFFNLIAQPFIAIKSYFFSQQVEPWPQKKIAPKPAQLPQPAVNPTPPPIPLTSSPIIDPQNTPIVLPEDSPATQPVRAEAIVDATPIGVVIENEPAPSKEQIENNDNDDDNSAYDDDDSNSDSFSTNSTEEYMKQFQANKTNTTEASKIIKKIILELTDPEDAQDAIDAKDTMMDKYKEYDKETQKIFATLLFTKGGSLYNPNKDAIATNKTGTLIAKAINTSSRYSSRLIIVKKSQEKPYLLVHPLVERPIRALQFNPTGNCLAVSYKKNKYIQYAPLDIFVQEKNGEYRRHMNNISNAPEIIGLLFINNNTLLTLSVNDEDYIINEIIIDQLDHILQQQETALFQRALMQKIRGLQLTPIN